MRTDVLAELKSLRLHGMAQAWTELEAQGDGMGLQTSRWLLEHLLRAEQVERHMRSVAHQLKSARFPLHRDLAGFDFEGSAVDEPLVKQLADLSFTDQAHNVVLIGGPFALLGDTVLDTVRRAMEQNMLAPLPAAPRLELSRLGDSSEVRGAALLAVAMVDVARG